MIDTHAHLNFTTFNQDLPQVVKRANNAGVIKIIIPGAKIDSSSKAVQIACQYPCCFAAIGIHPHHANEYEINKKLMQDFSNLLINKKVVAVGEIGLDYHRYRDYPEITNEVKRKQEELLLFQLDLSVKHNLPVIIHCREAYKELLHVITNYINKYKIMGVFHCFSGNEKNLKKVLDMNFYVGFDGNITYQENNYLRDLIKITPLERILVETDSPYLTPIPFRGLRNEPKNLIYIISEIARIKNTNIQEINNITHLNSVRLFKV